MTPYDFDSDLKFGQEYEELFAEYLRRYQNEAVLETNNPHFDIKTDKWIYEVKSDRVIESSNNICLELMSCWEKKSEGWWFTSKADWLVYFNGPKVFYMYYFPCIKDLVYNLKAKVELKQITQDTGSHTIFWLVDKDALPHITVKL